MRCSFLIAVSVVAFVASHAGLDDAAGAAAEAASPRGIVSGGTPAPLTGDDVARLIADLGGDQYAVRRRAEEELIRLGPDAYDQLKLAENNPDLEIAERIHYILERMRVEWVRPDDSSEVRRLLVRYGDLSEKDRDDRIQRLAKLKQGAGLAALCRIARFEPSAQAARHASIAILNRKVDGDRRLLAGRECQQELGASQRTPVQWLGIYVREAEDPHGAAREWAAAIESEVALLKAKSADTDFMVVYDLVERDLNFCNSQKLGDETTAALVEIVNLSSDEHASEQMAAGVAWVLQWVIQHERWDVLPAIETKYGDQFRVDRKLLYYLAGALSRAGRTDRASELSEKAFRLEADDEADRVQIAKRVADLGFVDWAEREFHRAVEKSPVISRESMDARTELANWQSDREDYKAAADVLGEFANACDADRTKKAQLVQELRDNGYDGREAINAALARREYYAACYFESHREYDHQREHLEIAAGTNEKDPDILIAMYRFTQPDAKFTEDVKARIRRVTKYQQALVDEFSDSPGAASYYNQWAWLVGNTEGDQQKAIEYSQRSLELQPEEPSFLDTLARCYFAVGDIDKAVEYERRAVKLAPHYRVMQRSLAEYEKAKAEKSSKGSSDTPK